MIHTFLLVKTVSNSTVKIIKWELCLMACIVSLAKTVLGSTVQIIKWKLRNLCFTGTCVPVRKTVAWRKSVDAAKNCDQHMTTCDQAPDRIRSDPSTLRCSGDCPSESSLGSGMDPPFTWHTGPTGTFPWVENPKQLSLCMASKNNISTTL